MLGTLLHTHSTSSILIALALTRVAQATQRPRFVIYKKRGTCYARRRASTIILAMAHITPPSYRGPKFPFKATKQMLIANFITAHPSTIPSQDATPFSELRSYSQTNHCISVAIKSILGTSKIKLEPTTDFMLRRSQYARPASLPRPNAG